jgi:hypothetical protein
MKDFRFYQEFGDAKKTVPTGNCIATYTATMPESLAINRTVECFSGVYFEPDSPCCFGSVSVKYLGEKCKRVSEEKARAIHPKLFRRIEEGW